MPLYERIKALPENHCKLRLSNAVEVHSDTPDPQAIALTKELKPWRKGPFELFETYIDSEWQSFIKYNLIEPHLTITDKNVLDIGCSNGYYSFKMLDKAPASITAIDPSSKFYLQFLLIDHYAKSGIHYYPIGIDDIVHLNQKYDTILCLGILYHRHNPIEQLKKIRQFLKKDGYLIVDNLIIETEGEYVLSPSRSYAKMKNTYFIPSIEAFRGWLIRAGYQDIELIAKKPTDNEEQRKTEWIEGESLKDFLDPADKTKTIEGYPAPIRAYFIARS